MYYESPSQIYHSHQEMHKENTTFICFACYCICHMVSIVALTHNLITRVHVSTCIFFFCQSHEILMIAYFKQYNIRPSSYCFKVNNQDRAILYLPLRAD